MILMLIVLVALSPFIVWLSIFFLSLWVGAWIELIHFLKNQ